MKPIMLTPFERYQLALSSGQYLPDETQANIVKHLQVLHHELEKNISRPWFGKKPKLKGLYLWGSVGIGKTWLMDLFFESLTSRKKWRVHFHDFMREVHEQLQQHQGKQDPLEKIAKAYARKTSILCFDEFFVSDIADAMILSKLFETLFKEHIVIIATSNVSPDDLYKNGLQRGRFLPAINSIKKHMDVLHLATTKDYRLRELEEAGVFFYPPDPVKLKQLFLQLAHNKIHDQKDIYLYDRPIQTIAYADNIIWLDFKKLCHTPRSQMDYLSIAKRWSIVIIDHLSMITEKETNTARYFINLIDILYDMKTTLILSSSVTLDELYPKGELVFEFQRTKSRLTEMQSILYLKQAENAVGVPLRNN
jgi:cell division protein ZapE